MSADMGPLRTSWIRKLNVCFVEEVTAPGPCWLWTGAASKGRGSAFYGRVQFDGKTCITHRVIYELLVGPIPDGMQLDHLCRQTLCCSPNHLEPVTGKTNCERGTRATRTHCVKAGHPLSGDNLRIQVDQNGREHRVCRACNRETSAAWQLARAERQRVTWAKYLGEEVAS